MQNIEAFEKAIGYSFKDKELIKIALTHSSYANENKLPRDNERLEFLGDSVLGFITAEYLFSEYKSRPEGELTKLRAAVVCEKSLFKFAEKISLGDYIYMGKGEENSGGRQKKAILADAMEAVFGAYYLDSGFKSAEKLILELLVPEIEKVWENKHNHKDFKTMLQEMYQKKYKQCPKYNLVKKTGPDHDMVFWVTVEINGKTYGPEKGKSKKEAEQSVAKKVIEELEMIEDWGSEK